MYIIKTPWWLRQLYPTFIWQMPSVEPTIYLTFDDGPHETATPFALQQLQQFNAKATFFCIGKNVQAHPAIYASILQDGHAVGNHTQNHLKGWATADQPYIDNTKAAAQHIQSHLFRPPYGRIKRTQARHLQQSLGFKIIMWSVLSADFDTHISGAQCWQHVQQHTQAGSIVLFHDSAKAWDRMSYALPKTLEFFSAKGFQFKPIVFQNS